MYVELQRHLLRDEDVDNRVLLDLAHAFHVPIVATNGGSSTHPGWYHNLKANPRITIEVGTQTFTVLADELDDAARAALWPRLVAESPSVGEFQDRTTRKIPVFMLTRQDHNR